MAELFFSDAWWLYSDLFPDSSGVCVSGTTSSDIDGSRSFRRDRGLSNGVRQRTGSVDSKWVERQDPHRNVSNHPSRRNGREQVKDSFDDDSKLRLTADKGGLFATGQQSQRLSAPLTATPYQPQPFVQNGSFGAVSNESTRPQISYRGHKMLENGQPLHKVGTYCRLRSCPLAHRVPVGRG